MANCPACTTPPSARLTCSWHGTVDTKAGEDRNFWRREAAMKLWVAPESTRADTACSPNFTGSRTKGAEVCSLIKLRVAGLSVATVLGTELGGFYPTLGSGAALCPCKGLETHLRCCASTPAFGWFPTTKPGPTPGLNTPIPFCPFSFPIGKLKGPFPQLLDCWQVALAVLSATSSRQLCGPFCHR